MSSNGIEQLTVDDLAAYLERKGADVSAKEAVDLVKNANAMMAAVAELDREQKKLGRDINSFVDQHWATCMQLDLLFDDGVSSSFQDDFAEGLEGLALFQGAMQRVKSLSELPRRMKGVELADAVVAAGSSDPKAEEEAAYRKIFGIPDPPTAR